MYRKNSNFVLILMSGLKQHRFDITMKVKSIDQWKRLNCVISKETYENIVQTTGHWLNEKNPMSVWKDKDEKEHYFIKVKLSQWDSQLCNFQRMERFIGKNVACTFFAKEYKFTPQNSQDEQSGWSAVLKSNTIR